MLKEKKGGSRAKGGLLQFVTAFGLTISVVLGFYFGYLIGQPSGRETYTGVLGALVGFLLGLAGLIWLDSGEDKGRN